MAVALHEAELFTWSEFQASLIDAVAAWEKNAGAGEPYEYYERFAVALANLLEAKRFVGDADLSARIHEFAARPHDHDHSH